MYDFLGVGIMPANGHLLINIISCYLDLTHRSSARFTIGTSDSHQKTMEESVEWQKAQRGELHHAFVPELIAVRRKCAQACHRFNTAENMS
jgi:hypothetical protein